MRARRRHRRRRPLIPRNRPLLHAVLHDTVYARCVPSAGRSLAAGMAFGPSWQRNVAGTSRRAMAGNCALQLRRRDWSWPRPGSCTTSRVDEDRGCSDSARLPQRSAGRRQGRPSAGSPSFPTNGPADDARAQSWRELGRVTAPDARAARRSGSKRCSCSTRTRGAAQEPDRAVHRARDAQLEDRAPALVGAVRPHAGVPGRVPRVRARSVRSTRRTRNGSSCCPSCSAGSRAPRPRRQDRGSIATSSGSPPNGRSCTRCSRSPARASSSGRQLPLGAGAHRRRRSSTSTCSSLVLQLMNAGNMTAPPPRVGLRTSSTTGARRCGFRSSRRRSTSFYVDLASARRLEAPHAGAARGHACCSSTRGRCTRC